MPVEGSVYSLCEPKEGVDFREGGFDFSDLDVEVLHGAWQPRAMNLRRATAQSAANHHSMTPPSKSLRTVLRCSGGKPQSMTTGRLNFSRASMNGAAVALASNRVFQAVRQAVSVKHAGFFHVEVQEPLLLFEPPAEGGFPRSWDAGDEEVHGVSLACSRCGG